MHDFTIRRRPADIPRWWVDERDDPRGGGCFYLEKSSATKKQRHWLPSSEGRARAKPGLFVRSVGEVLGVVGRWWWLYWRSTRGVGGSGRAVADAAVVSRHHHRHQRAHAAVALGPGCCCRRRRARAAVVTSTDIIISSTTTISRSSSSSSTTTIVEDLKLEHPDGRPINVLAGRPGA
jgi:hypothetical protein